LIERGRYDSSVIRRVTAIAAWVLLLHLNLVASDLVCSTHHESADGATPSAMQHHVGMTHTSQISDVSESGKAPCTVPARTDCCRAMMSCAVSIGVMTATAPHAPSARHSAVADSPAQCPTSRTRAPETPPPKA
jgi:hypothetical protein